MAVKIQEYEVPVSEIIVETPETKTFRFVMKDMFDFKPGQFVMLTVEIPGKGPVARAYSISSSLLDPFLELTIKKFEGGLLSKFVVDNLKVGDRVKLRGPYGMFVLNEQAKKIAFIAAGSGIAPFRSMWRYAIQKHLDIKMMILFSSKTQDYIIFRKELEQLNNSGVRVVHTLTRNQDPNWKGYSRRIDKEMLKEVVTDSENVFFYICGPPPMCAGTVETLKELGVEATNIKMEKFE